MTDFSPVPKPPKREQKAKKRPKRSNPARKASEFLRCYGSAERVAWVKSLPCFACGLIGHTENAHLPSHSGAGRKGDARHIVPLCHSCHDHKVYLQRPFTYALVASKIEKLWPTTSRHNQESPR